MKFSKKIQGLQYLHKSRVGYHGMLSVKSCLIDANWVLRMSNFGLSTALNEFIANGSLQVIEKIPQYSKFYSVLTLASNEFWESRNFCFICLKKTLCFYLLLQKPLWSATVPRNSPFSSAINHRVDQTRFFHRHVSNDGFVSHKTTE